MDVRRTLLKSTHLQDKLLANRVRGTRALARVCAVVRSTIYGLELARSGSGLSNDTKTDPPGVNEKHP